MACGGHTALCCFATPSPPSSGLQGLAEAQSDLPGGRLPAGMKGSPAKPPPQGPPAPSATGSRSGRFNVPGPCWGGRPRGLPGRLERVSLAAWASQDRGVGRRMGEDREGSPPYTTSFSGAQGRPKALEPVVTTLKAFQGRSASETSANCRQGDHRGCACRPV